MGLVFPLPIDPLGGGGDDQLENDVSVLELTSLG